jgi:hypothetical protein
MVVLLTEGWVIEDSSYKEILFVGKHVGHMVGYGFAAQKRRSRRIGNWRREWDSNLVPTLVLLKLLILQYAYSVRNAT